MPRLETAIATFGFLAGAVMYPAKLAGRYATGHGFPRISQTYIRFGGSELVDSDHLTDNLVLAPHSLLRASN